MVQALYSHLPSCISVNETAGFPLALGSPICASPIQHSYSKHYLLLVYCLQWMHKVD